MKVLAYYLPQFHRVPENDVWWGEGFTEWSNVKKAQPLFEGHYQPRIPAGENYYDLTDVNNIKWQAELARDNGVYGFCLYHYWFDGKLLLNKPMELLRDHKEIDVNYCICWANENWTNGWVSDNNRILIEHHYDNQEDWKAHFEYLLTYFKDDRYIMVDGKPLLVIYYPTLAGKSLKPMMDYWNEEAIKAGFNGITFVYQHSLYYLDKSAHKEYFQYGIEFEPGFSQRTMAHIKDTSSINNRIRLTTFLQNKLHIYLQRNAPEKVTMLDFDKVWEEVLHQELEENIFPGAFVGWDNTPRKGARGSVMANSTPEKFKKYFKRLVEKTRNSGKDFIFLFAWNEWSEGGYLEPDEKYGTSYIEAVRDALYETNEWPYKSETKN